MSDTTKYDNAALIAALERLAAQEAGAARLADTQQAASVASGARERSALIRQAIAVLTRAEADAHKSAPGALDYDRVRREVPECAGLTDHQIVLSLCTLEWRLAEQKDITAAVCATSPQVLDYCNERNMLAAINACRVPAPEPEVVDDDARIRVLLQAAQDADARKDAVDRDSDEWYEAHATAHNLREAARYIGDLLRRLAEPDPEIPEGLSDGALMALVHMLWLEPDTTWDYPRPAHERELRMALLVERVAGTGGGVSLTSDGRALARRLAANMRRKLPEPQPIGYSPKALLGFDEGEKAAEPIPEPRWSEPIAGMDWERCYNLCAAMGRRLSTRRNSPSDWAWSLTAAGRHDMMGDFFSHGHAAREATLWLARQVAGRYDGATGRINLTGLEVE